MGPGLDRISGHTCLTLWGVVLTVAAARGWSSVHLRDTETSISVVGMRLRVAVEVSILGGLQGAVVHSTSGGCESNSRHAQTPGVKYGSTDPP